MQEWEVRVDREVVKALDRLTPKLRERLWVAIRRLRENPFPPGVEKMKDTTDEWRLRVGEYRLIYRVDTRQRFVETSDFGHRRDVYRGWWQTIGKVMKDAS